MPLSEDTKRKMKKLLDQVRPENRGKVLKLAAVNRALRMRAEQEYMGQPDKEHEKRWNNGDSECSTN